MVVRFQPQQTNFRALPSISTDSQDAAAAMFGLVSSTFNQVAKIANQQQRQAELENQEEIKAQAVQAQENALDFANKSLAAKLSSDFNKTLGELRQKHKGDPVGLAQELTAFAEGQARGLGGVISRDDYLSIVAPKINAFTAMAQKQGNAEAKQLTEESLQEALALKQDEILSLDFSVAQSEAAVGAGVAEFTAIVSQLDIPDTNKQRLIDGFQKELKRKSIIDLFDNAEDKVQFIEDVQNSDIDGFDAEEKDELLSSLVRMNNLDNAVQELVSAEEVAQQKVLSANLHADLRIKINDPRTTANELAQAHREVEQLRANGTLTPEQSANLIIEINNKVAKSTENTQAMARVAAVLNGELFGLDPDDKATTAAVDKIAEGILEQGGGAEVMMTKMANLIGATGIVPEAVQRQFRIAARSRDPEVIALSAEMYSRIEEQSPGVLRDLSPKEVALFDEVADLVRAGMSKEEAVKSARETSDPLNSAVVARIDKEMREKDLTNDALMVLNNMFDTPFFGINADMSINNVTKKIVDDYEKAFRSFYQHKQDDNFAKREAMKVLKRKWGVTRVDNRRRVMAYPPEKYYAIKDVDNDWMQEDFKKSFESVANKFAPTAKFEDAFLVADPITAREANATGKPKYRINYINKDGITETLTDENNQPVLWQPDREGQIKKMNKKELEKAREKRNRKLGQDISADLLRSRFGIGRGGF